MGISTKTHLDSVRILELAGSRFRLARLLPHTHIQSTLQMRKLSPCQCTSVNKIIVYKIKEKQGPISKYEQQLYLGGGIGNMG